MTETQVAANIADIKKKIAKASSACGRARDCVHLIAVSKMQPPARVKAALDAGQRVFGENRVQEARERWEDLRPAYPDLRLHLIGPLQTNKVTEAVSLFDCIQTVDRPKLARMLADEMKAQGKTLPCFIQVNTGEEPQKAGILPAALPEFYDFCTRECGLSIKGLMCIPPAGEPPALHFAFLGKLARACGLEELSMGMSADFEKAIPLGATYIRVGTALFGNRAL